MQPSVRLDRVQQGLFTIASRMVTAGVVDQAAWSYGSKPYQVSVSADPESLLRLELTSGPSVGNLIGAHGDYLWKVPDSIVVRILSVNVGERIWLNLNRFEHWHDVSGVDTTLTIRDAFIASINAAEQGRVIASVVDDNELALTATAVAPATDPFGNLWYLELAPGQTTLLVGDGVFSDRAVKVKSGSMGATLTLSAYSKSHELRNGAQAIIPEVLSELRKHDVIQYLSTYGMALRDRGPTVPIPTLRGAKWETRASVDVGFTLRSHVIEEVDLIERASAVFSVFPAPGATPFPLTIDAQAP